MDPIETTLITGALGSGKTTLISRLVTHLRASDTLVLINEFGEIEPSMNIDEINAFLNKNVDDKKLSGHFGLTEEE